LDSNGRRESFLYRGPLAFGPVARIPHIMDSRTEQRFTEIGGIRKKLFRNPDDKS
jgi:hypothetical protein